MNPEQDRLADLRSVSALLLERYVPSPDADAWLTAGYRLCETDLGVLAMLGPNGVGVADVRAATHRASIDPVCLLLAGLQGHVREQNLKVAIGLPPAARDLPLLLAASAVLADTLARALSPDDRATGVLVVTPDLSIRGQYLNLYVGNECLDDAKPGTRLKASGDREILRPWMQSAQSRARRGTSRDRAARVAKRQSADSGVCFFRPSGPLPQHLAFRPGMLVLDLRYARWVQRAGDLAAWAGAAFGGPQIALYTLGDSDTWGALQDAGFSDFPLDHAAIQESLAQTPMRGFQSGSIDWQVAAAAEFTDRRHRVSLVSGNQAIDRALVGIGELLHRYRDHESLDLHRARWLLATLTQVPVPIEWYERAAVNAGRSTLRRMIERLGNLDRGSDIPASVIGTLKMYLEQVRAGLQADNPRVGALREQLATIHARPAVGDTLVLVRDRTMQQAMTSWLLLEGTQNEPWAEGVSVVACADYAPMANTRVATIVINGAFPRRYRWIAGAALAEEVIFLLYSHEMDIVERQLEYVYGGGHIRSRSSQVGRVLGSNINPTLPQGPGRLIIPVLRLDKPQKIATAVNEPEGDEYRLENLASMLEELTLPPVTSEAQFSLQDKDEPSEDFDDSTDVEQVECLRFEAESRMRGPGTVWIPVDGTVEIIRTSAKDSLLRVATNEVTVGDVMVLGGNENREGLFERMVSLADEQPERKG